MSNSKAHSSQGHTTQREVVAIVGYNSTLLPLARDRGTSNDPQIIQQLLSQGIRHCLTEAGVSTSMLQKNHAAAYIGLSEVPDGEDEPYKMAPRIGADLGLEHPGLTVEAGEASDLAALHFANLALLAGTTRLALVAEIQSTENKVNVMLLQTLPDAMEQGSRIHGLLKASIMVYNSDAASVLAQVCQKGELALDQVSSMPEAPSGALGAMISWLGDGKNTESESIATGFCTHSQSGMWVGLLLQAPILTLQPAPGLAEQNEEWHWERDGDRAILPETMARPPWVPNNPQRSAIPTLSARSDNFGWSAGRAMPGRTCLGLQWENAEEIDVSLLALTHGEV